ncbi:hypothetical protein CYMTET_21581 [Cymbomonas tetramitiformis]|uniref:Exostosin GT47 domain-containing protein n=1 Tax=Cymbomonas tetramitiformis TaxID=36881 RepID=A0AAE0L2R6_9CHLO|nr:hypothetical protein CYMTET_21581 [Cymbomonas tetramitiformis]
MDSQEDSDFEQENDGSDDESRALEERLLEAEARRKRYTKRLDDHENVGSSRGGDARHRKRPERKDVEEQNASDSEEKEAIPRGGRVGRMRAQFLGWQSQGMRNTNLALAVLGSCLLTVICIFWLHYSQEVEYWKELEGVVRSERAAREEAQRAAEEVQRTSAAEVQKLTAAMPSALASTTPLSCPPAKECPKPTKCPPVEAATSPAQPAQETNELDFKVYVYDLPGEFHSDLKRDQRRCVNDQYGTEIRFHENLLQSSFRTTNPDEAEFFFVPIYGECFLFRENQLAGKQALANTNRWYRKALSILWHDYPMWNKTQGRDHIFVFAGARALCGKL